MATKSIVRPIRQTVRKWQTDLSLPFEQVLPASVVAQAAESEKIVFRERFFSPSHHALGILGSGSRGRRLLSPSRQPCHRVFQAAWVGSALLRNWRLL